MTFISDPVTVKARKKHFCHWCEEDILPGETYVRWFCSEGGETKVHPECYEAWGRASLLTPKDDAWYDIPGEHDCGLYCVGPGQHPRGEVLTKGDD